MGPKILTVDDSKTIRLIVAKAFKFFDCTVLEAANGVEGLAVATKEKPDIIILDLTMPIRADYLLSGTKSDVPPYVLTTDANGQVTSVTYQGNTTLAESEIAEGVTLTGQVLGANSTGSGPRGLITDSRVGADFFNHLISLQNNLTAGTPAAIAAIAATDRPQLAKDEDNFIVQFGINGSTQSRLDTASAIATQRSASLENLVSKEADADLSQTIVRLHETQNAYQAALQSGGSILNRSLLDYLH